MNDRLKEIERQIEIFTIFYPTKKVHVFSVSGLAEKFKVDENTILNDFKALQFIGFPIDQIDTGGVNINGDADPNVLKILLFKYISTFHSEIIVSNSLYELTYGREMTPVNNLRDILKAIEANEFVKLRYKVNYWDIVELTVLPYQIITNKSELEFIGIHNNTVDTYQFSKVISIEGTANYDSNNYNLLVEEFYKKYLFPSAKIKVKIVTAQKYWIEDYMLFEITTSKIEDDIIGEEVKHFSLKGLSVLDLRYSENLPDFSQDYFWNFSTWMIEQYCAIKVIDNEKVRETLHRIATSPLIQSFKKSTTSTKDTRKDETITIPITNSKPPSKPFILKKEISTSVPKNDIKITNEIRKDETITIPITNSKPPSKPFILKEEINANVPNKDISILQKPSLDSDKSDKDNTIKNYCGPDLPIKKQLPTYDSFEIELSIKDLYDYREVKPPISLIKRMLKWLS